MFLDKRHDKHGSRRRPAKPSEADDGQALEEELGLAGAAEEDAEAEFISRDTETEVLSAENLLGLLSNSDPELRAAASLALAYFMIVR